MKEVTFRWKCNIWLVYGYYIYSSMFSNTNDYYKHLIITKEGNTHEINIETLSQYTWLKDKNWKEIFEWDILKSNRTPSWREVNDFFILIEWNSNVWAFCIHDWLWWSRWSNINSHLADFFITWHNIYSFEVIWNIYENPELLTINKT
jgi:uncharacterized phage protein (TIGR01671 family)